MALAMPGKEKSLGWYGLTSKFFKEVWDEVEDPVAYLANRALME